METNSPAHEEGLTVLAACDRDLIVKAEAIDSPKKPVLDIDSTQVPVYGQQEQSAYGGHFESTCYHARPLFDREGYCLTGNLRPGNVHGTDDGEGLLLPEIDRQQW
jgi:hypothetical protein